MYRMLILLTLLLAAPLCAHQATLRGNASMAGTPNLEGIKISVEADPLWGHPDAESLAITEQAKGKYPKVTLSGETTTDAQGNYVLKVEFTFSGDETPPTRKQSRDNKQVDVEYCCARLTASHEGFRPGTMQVVVISGGDDLVSSIQLSPIVAVSGRIVNLAGRNGVPNLELQFTTIVRKLSPWSPSTGNRGGTGGRRGAGGAPQIYVDEPQNWIATTDKDGRFVLKDETVPPANFTLFPLGGNLAFAATSKAAGGIHLRNGENDLGDLMVVPGGSLKFRVVNDIDDQPVMAQCVLSGERYRKDFFALVDGTAEFPGMIEGEFTLSMYHHKFWATEQKVRITAGELTDLGDIRLDPMLSLDVIALSDTDSGIETYNVTATMIEGTVPPNYGQQFRVRADLTAESTTLNGLRKGKWLVTVAAKGYAPEQREIELPTDGPVTVTLKQGGGLSASVEIGGNRNAYFTLYAVRCDCEYYKTLTALEDAAWKNLKLDTQKPGVYGANRDWGARTTIDALPPGDYLVLAFTGNLGVLREDNVTVSAGKTTTVVLKPEPPVLEVTVTRDGKPAAGITISFVVANYGRQAEIAEETTGLDGKCSHEFANAGEAYVLTEREMKWLDKPGEDVWRWSEALRKLKGNATAVAYGTHSEVSIELNDPKGIWVSITIKAPEGVTLDPPVLRPAGNNNGWPQYTGKSVDGVWLFPRVPAGNYTLYTGTRSGGREYVALTRDIEVSTPPEHNFEIEFEVKTFTVTLDLPEGVTPQQVHVSLLTRQMLGRFDEQNYRRESAPDASGKVAFVGLEDGEYIIVGTAWDQQRGQALATGNVAVNTATSSKATLRLNDEFGTLQLRVEGNPAVGGQDQRAMWQVQFFDAMEEEVLPGDPSVAFGYVNTVGNVVGVPTGTYKVVVCGYGLQPVAEQNVEIKRGITTELTVTPSAAALLKLTIEGIDARSMVQLKASSAYRDANGRSVEINAPGKQLFVLMPSQRGNACEAWLLNLTPEVTQVVISVEGYEDIVIAVKAEPGKTILHTGKAVRKAD